MLHGPTVISVSEQTEDSWGYQPYLTENLRFEVRFLFLSQRVGIVNAPLRKISIAAHVGLLVNSAKFEGSGFGVPWGLGLAVSQAWWCTLQFRLQAVQGCFVPNGLVQNVCMSCSGLNAWACLGV